MKICKNILVLFTLIFFFGSNVGFSDTGKDDSTNVKSIYDFIVNDIDGKEIKLEQFKGKAMVIVNVASKCGYTPQYEGLQEIYEKYKDEGLVVLGFPANNFRNQEPGSNEEIKQFCRVNYGVTFPMFEKISIKGDDIAPLYKYLTSQETNPEFHGEITWNFNKFVIDRNGNIVNRFESNVEPESKQFIEAIESALNK